METKQLLLIKLGETESGVNEDNKVLYINPYDSMAELDNRVLVYSKTHCSICRNKSNFVKIKSDKSKRSIYRICTAQAAKGFGKNYAALTINSMHKLEVEKAFKKGEDVDISISRTWWLPFYWNHPFHATRISMRIGLISIILGLIGILV